MIRPRVAAAVVCLAVFFSTVLEAYATGVRVKCEERPSRPRSKISVDGFDLAPGDYIARVTSGLNVATSAAQPAVGDEVEFDFDSDAGDIADGATAIAPNFIQGDSPQATGQILDAAGNAVAAAAAQCEVK